MKKQYLVEALGTFFLVLVVALSADALAVSGVLVALVYMGGYISGAHYNPAVTLGMYLINKISKEDAKNYVLAQMIGGFFASVVFSFISSGKFILSPSEQTGIAEAFLIEAIFTFLLVTVIYHVAVSEKQKNNQYYGLAIGMVILAAATSGGDISGGAFNPAVGIAPLFYDVKNIADYLPQLFLYSAGPLTGAALAAWFYRKK